MVVLLFPVLVQAWLVTMAIEWRKGYNLRGAWEMCVQLSVWGVGCCVTVWRESDGEKVDFCHLSFIDYIALSLNMF